MKKKITIQDRIKEKQIEEKIRKNLNEEDKDKKIVIEKRSKFVEILIFLRNTIFKLIKLVFLLAIAVLSSIGLTVLLNETTRIVFIDLVKQVM